MIEVCFCEKAHFYFTPPLPSQSKFLFFWWVEGTVEKYWGTETKNIKKTAFWRCLCFAPVVSAVACLISSKPHKSQTKRTVPLVCDLRQRLESATPHHQRRPP